MNKFYLILCLSASLAINAQTSIKKELKLIESNEQAEQYIEANNSKKNKLITFNEEKHNSMLAKSLFLLSKGGTKVNENEFDKTYYKIIEKIKTKHYRVSSIFLDGNKMSLDKINLIREDIINKYENGLPFENLVKKHSMGNNVDKSGDMGWLSKKEILPEFDKITSEQYSVGDIFNIDMPLENKYYVIVKTHEPKDINEIKILKIVERK